MSGGHSRWIGVLHFESLEISLNRSGRRKKKFQLHKNSTRKGKSRFSPLTHSIRSTFTSFRFFLFSSRFNAFAFAYRFAAASRPFDHSFFTHSVAQNKHSGPESMAKTQSKIKKKKNAKKKLWKKSWCGNRTAETTNQLYYDWELWKRHKKNVRKALPTTTVRNE